MKTIMSRALMHQYCPSRRVSVTPTPPTSHISSNQAAAANHLASHSSTTPTSPLDFTDRIPISEIKLYKETLGSGSFGTVYKGQWCGRNVAVKQFKTRDEIDSFIVEVKQLSCVKHPNIVKLYGASTLTDTAYLVMEYAEGGSLNRLLHERTQQGYDLRHACSWAMQTARGVAYLHGIRPKPIMHRDLKPANLLLFERGKILKICDFGTACAVKTQMTNNTGSASYMAPEVFASSSYLESGDVFSWSIIFWEILVRKQPYYLEYSNPFAILWAVNQGERPPIIEGCPKPIWNLITRSWNKDPASRPTMQEVAQEMEFIFLLTERRNNQTTVGNNTCNSSSNNTRSFNRSSSERHRQNPAASSINSSRHSHRPSAGDLAAPVSPTPTNFDIGNRQNHVVSSFADLRHQHHQPQHRRQDHHHHHPLELSQQSNLDSQLQMHLLNQQTMQLAFEHQQLLSPQHSTHSQMSKLNRRRALLRHIEMLQGRVKYLENELETDTRNTTEQSLKEYERLTENIRTLNSQVKEVASPTRSEHRTPAARLSDGQPTAPTQTKPSQTWQTD